MSTPPTLEKYIESYYWSSMSPERSGQSLKTQIENDLSTATIKLLENNVPQSEIEAFESKYWDFCSKYLSQSAKVASTGITGRSGFNYARNEKASISADKTMKNWLEWTEFKVNQLIKRALPYIDPKEQADSELTDLLKEQAQYKEHNKTAKKNGLDMVPSWKLTNLNNRIKARKAKIEKINKQEVLAETNPVEILSEKNGLKIFIDNSIQRVVFKHDSKPSSEEIATLKQKGFRWSPKNLQWQAFINRNSLDFAKSSAGIVEETKVVKKRDFISEVMDKYNAFFAFGRDQLNDQLTERNLPLDTKLVSLDMGLYLPKVSDENVENFIKEFNNASHVQKN